MALLGILVALCSLPVGQLCWAYPWLGKVLHSKLWAATAVAVGAAMVLQTSSMISIAAFVLLYTALISVWSVSRLRTVALAAEWELYDAVRAFPDSVLWCVDRHGVVVWSIGGGLLTLGLGTDMLRNTPLSNWPLHPTQGVAIRRALAGGKGHWVSEHPSGIWQSWAVHGDRGAVVLTIRPGEAMRVSETRVRDEIFSLAMEERRRRANHA